jgi:hypothetical protein
LEINPIHCALSGIELKRFDHTILMPLGFLKVFGECKVAKKKLKRHGQIHQTTFSA